MEFCQAGKVGTLSLKLENEIVYFNEKKEFNLDVLHADMFSISTDGEIKSRETFDYERKTEYVFGVSVRDNGEPSYVSRAQVTITVEDVNDHAPRFMLDLYEGMIVEDDHNPQPQQVVEMVCST